MARARKAAKGKHDDSSRPSTFFIIALILGFVVLVWWFMHFMLKKATGEKQGRSGVVEMVVASVS